MICAICGYEIEGFAHGWRPGQVICFDCRVKHDPALAGLRNLGNTDPLVALRGISGHPPEYWRQLDRESKEY